MDVYTIQRIENSIEGTDIYLESVNIDTMEFFVVMPYESSTIVIEVKGKSDQEIVQSFKDGVNHRLNEMINHLNDSKLV